MAVDMFMAIDDIEGESADSTHKKEIDVLGWRWRAHQVGSAHVGSGTGSGKAAVEDLVVEMAFEKSSPTIMSWLLSGKPFTKATLTIRKAGGQPIEYIKIVMKTGIISDMSLSGTPSSDFQMVSVSLNFAEVEIHYKPQMPDGTAGPETVIDYNIAGTSPGSS
jgi:type VI secretion system secreted protein Hcp